MLVSSTASYFDATLVNAGPLTTTFTPPPGCTRPPNHGILLIHGNNTGHWAASCETTPVKAVSQCIPSESSWVNAPPAAAVTTNYTPQYELMYYSPGLVCPSGWETKGVAVVGKDMKTTSSGRAFSTNTPWQDDEYQLLPYASYFVDNMQPMETAIFCCPSGYDTDYLGGCSSSAGDPQKFGHTMACRLEQTVIQRGKNVTELHGRTYSPPLQLPDTLGPTLTPTVIPLPLPQETATGTKTAEPVTSVAVDYVQVIVLIHKDTDSSAAAVVPKLSRAVAVVSLTMALTAIIFA